MPILAAPLVIPFAEAVGISIATLGMAKGADMVNDYIQENPEESAMILKTLVPNLGIGQIFMNKEKISLEDLEEMTDEEAQDLSKEEKAELMKQGGKSRSKDKRQTMIDLSEKLGLSGEGREQQDIEYEVDERYDEGGVEDAPKPKFDYKKFFRNRRADGGAIGIEVLFEEKKPRKDFNIGGNVQRVTTPQPYDARASATDFARAIDTVGAGTNMQKAKAIQSYDQNVQRQNMVNRIQKMNPAGTGNFLQGIKDFGQHAMVSEAMAGKTGKSVIPQYGFQTGYDFQKKFTGLDPKISAGLAAAYQTLQEGSRALNPFGDTFLRFPTAMKTAQQQATENMEGILAADTGTITPEQQAARNEYLESQGQPTDASVAGPSRETIIQRILKEIEPGFENENSIARMYADDYKTGLDLDYLKTLTPDEIKLALDNAYLQGENFQNPDFSTGRIGGGSPFFRYGPQYMEQFNMQGGPLRLSDQYTGYNLRNELGQLESILGKEGIKPYMTKADDALIDLYRGNYSGDTDLQQRIFGLKDGGRVGLFMGGDPLTGQALSIYNSMNSYGFTDQQIADALRAQGLYDVAPVETPVTNTAPNIINQGGGDGPPGPDPTGTKTYGKTFTGMTMPDGTPIGSSGVVEGVGIIDGLKNAATGLFDLYSKFSPIGIFSNFMKQRSEKQQELQDNAIDKAKKEREMQQAIKDAEAAQAALNNAVRTGRRAGSGGAGIATDDTGTSYDAGGREGFGYGLKDGGLVSMFVEKR
jgi:hypothetical protein